MLACSTIITLFITQSSSKLADISRGEPTSKMSVTIGSNIDHPYTRCAGMKSLALVFFLSDLIDQVLTLWNDPNKWANAVEVGRPTTSRAAAAEMSHF